MLDKVSEGSVEARAISDIDEWGAFGGEEIDFLNAIEPDVSTDVIEGVGEAWQEVDILNSFNESSVEGDKDEGEAIDMKIYDPNAYPEFDEIGPVIGGGAAGSEMDFVTD